MYRLGRPEISGGVWAVHPFCFLLFFCAVHTAAFIERRGPALPSTQHLPEWLSIYRWRQDPISSQRRESRRDLNKFRLSAHLLLLVLRSGFQSSLHVSCFLFPVCSLVLWLFSKSSLAEVLSP